MPTENSQIWLLLFMVSNAIWLGIAASALMQLSYSITKSTSQQTGLFGEPDPTLFMRQFPMSFDRSFGYVGWSLASRATGQKSKALAFHLSISVAVVIITTVAYVVSAGVIVGSAMVSQQLFGLAFKPLPIFQMIVVAVVFFALATMFHSEERARQIAER